MDSLEEILKKNQHLIGKVAVQNSNKHEYLIRNVFIDNNEVMIQLQVGHEVSMFPVVEISTFEKTYTVNSN